MIPRARQLTVGVGVLAAAIAVGACAAPRCAPDEFWVDAHADTTYLPFVHPSGDTVTATIVTSWTDGCAPKGILEP